MGRLSRGAIAAGAQLALGLVAAAMAMPAGLMPPAETDIIVILCAVVVALEAGAQAGDDSSRIPAADRGLAAVTAAGVALVFFGSVAESARDGGTVPVPWFAAGVAVALVGAALRARSIHVLGRGFVTPARPVARERCVHDVYAYMRHPSEVGLLACLAGVALASRATSAGLGLATAAVASLVRVKREGRYLRARYPSSS